MNIKKLCLPFQCKVKISNSKYTQKFDGEIIDEISLRFSNQTAQIWKVNDTEENYVTQLEGKDDYYILQGVMNEKELIKIIQGITF